MFTRILAKLRLVAALLFTLLGVIHIVFTPVIYRTLNLPALWFVGMGLAPVFLSMLNLLTSSRSEKWVGRVVFVTNALGVVFMGVVAWRLAAAQAYVGLVLAATLLIGSFPTSSQVPAFIGHRAEGLPGSLR